MEDTQIYVCGFPIGTHITFINSDLQSLIIRIPGTFFTPSQYHRSVFYQGIRFDVHRNSNQVLKSAGVTTAILKFTPPKNLKELNELTAVLIYLAKNNHCIISQIKEMHFLQMSQLTIKAQSLSSQAASASQTSDQSQARGAFRKFPYSSPRVGKQSKTYKRSNKRVPLNPPQYTLPSNTGPPGGGSQQGDHLMSRDAASGMVFNHNMNPNNGQGHSLYNIPPPVYPQTSTSNNMSSVVGGFQSNEFRSLFNTNQKSNTDSGEEHGPLGGYNAQQLMTQNMPSNMTNTMNADQQNRFRKADQTIYSQTQVQFSNQINYDQNGWRAPHQATFPFLNQANRGNHNQFTNGVPLQTQNPSQELQLYPAANVPYSSAPFQMNIKSNSFVPQANMNTPRFHSGGYQAPAVPPTLNNPRAPNLFPPFLSNYMTESFNSFCPNKNQYSNNFTQWPNNASFVQNPGFPQNQIRQSSILANSHANNEKPSIDTSMRNYHHEEYQNWPKLPNQPNEPRYGIETTPSNNLMNPPDGVFNKMVTQRQPNVHSVLTNSSTNVSVNNCKPNDQYVSNTLIAQAKLPKYQDQTTEQGLNNATGTIVPQSVLTTAENSANSSIFDQEFSNILNMYLKSKIEKTVQTSKLQINPASANTSKNLLDIFANHLVKEEPRESTKDKGSNFSSADTQQPGTSKSLLPEVKKEIEGPGPELDDVMEVINNSVEMIASSDSSRSSAPSVLCIDENAAP